MTKQYDLIYRISTYLASHTNSPQYSRDKAHDFQFESYWFAPRHLFFVLLF